MHRAPRETVRIAILAKAPVPGLAKTRLADHLGPEGAALLQERFILRTVATGRAASAQAVDLWCDPDGRHPVFQSLLERQAVRLHRQPVGDLGARMSAAVLHAGGPVVVIGTDCPALEARHVRAAIEALREGRDAVLGPAEDGGYYLIAMRRLYPQLFADMAWSTDTVAAETRRRMTALRLSCAELPMLWDVDRPHDLDRMRREGFGDMLTGLAIRDPER